MNPYIPLLLLFGFVALLGGLILALSHLLGMRGRKSASKSSTYECGLPTIGEARNRLSVKFYLVAMLFILFDIEVVFFYPWAVLFKEYLLNGQGVFFFMEMVVFLVILLVGLSYVYNRRAIEWE